MKMCFFICEHPHLWRALIFLKDQRDAIDWTRAATWREISDWQRTNHPDCTIFKPDGRCRAEMLKEGAKMRCV